jgi:hypothetical protein
MPAPAMPIPGVLPATSSAASEPTADQASPLPAPLPAARAAAPQADDRPVPTSLVRLDAAHVPSASDRTASLIDPSPTAHDSAASPQAPAPANPLAALPPSPLAFNLALPPDAAPPEDPYRQRAADVRPALVEKLGGSDETEQAVNLALAWLARHQSADGRWDSRDFDDSCGHCNGSSRVKSDVALTGLAVLCFLGADHTHVKDGPYKDTVARALRWLLERQSEGTGDLRSGETMYSHGIAVIALAEALGMTRDLALGEPVERAARFIIESRDTSDGSGGWRYTPGQAGDTSVLGWQVMALSSARRAGLDLPQDPFDAAAAFLETVTPRGRTGGNNARSQRGLYAYQPGQRPSPSMTAEGLFCQQLLGRDRDHPETAAAVEYILQTPPSWEPRSGRGSSGAGGAPTYYWYYATLALFQHQGPAWDTWNESLKRELLAHQRRDGLGDNGANAATPADATGIAGSWDPVDKYSRVGGRIYQTAVCTLCLEVYYRYLPMYGAEPKAEP